MSLSINKKLLCMGLLLSVTAVEAQQYVGNGGEFGVFGPISVGTSTQWVGSRLAASAPPGYYSWTIGSGNYVGADDNHHVNGYVKKYGPEAFTFPVGSGTDLRTLSMSAPASPTEVYAAAWIKGDPGITPDPTNANAMHSTTIFSGDITAVSKLGQWDWQAIKGTGVGLDITVSIPAMTEAGFTDATKLRLVGWNGTAWVSLGGVASGLTEDSTLKGTMIAGIQAIGIGVSGSACKDTDGDHVPDYQEFNGDTDGDGIPDYLDPDDDGDTIMTIDEHPDPNGDCNVKDAWDSNANGIPDYLEANNIDKNLGSDELQVYNMINTSDDNPLNDAFVIRNIQLYPNNHVSFYDRWGVLIYETDDYDSKGNLFVGTAAADTAYKAGQRLSEDTYFYIIEYSTPEGRKRKRVICI